MPPVPDGASELLTFAFLLVFIAWEWIKAKTQRGAARDVQEVKEQVANSHDINLRDDIDNFRDEIRDEFREVRKDIRGVRREVGELRGQVREDRERLDEHMRNE